MGTLSGLRDSAQTFLGRPLRMDLEYGWCWTLHTHGRPKAEPFCDVAAVNLTSVRVLPSEFFADGGASTRGFLGRVGQPGHLLHDLPVLAFPMADGFHWDFTSRPCPFWRFFFGAGALVCRPDSFPRLRGPRILGGYGRVAAESPTAQSAEPRGAPDPGRDIGSGGS